MSDYMICILAETGTTLDVKQHKVLIYAQKLNFNVANVMPEKRNSYTVCMQL